MIDFKTWYAERYGAYPGTAGEPYDLVMSRVFDAFADYATQAVNVPANTPDRVTQTEQSFTGNPDAPITPRVPRFDISVHDGSATQSETGGWVSSKDYDAAEAERDRLREALRVYADPCEGPDCGYEGNMCCKTARVALSTR